jgi:hypothetical protein
MFPVITYFILKRKYSFLQTWSSKNIFACNLKCYHYIVSLLQCIMLVIAHCLNYVHLDATFCELVFLPSLRDWFSFSWSFMLLKKGSVIISIQVLQQLKGLRCDLTSRHTYNQPPNSCVHTRYVPNAEFNLTGGMNQPQTKTCTVRSISGADPA